MIQENVDITRRHTFGIPTETRAWGDYETVDELRKLIVLARSNEWEFMPIGEGSNLLFLRRYEGLLLHSLIKTIQVVKASETDILVQAGSGWIWDEFVAHCVSQGWAGLENLSYIPGTVGASAVQNVGAYGVEVGDVIESVTVLDTNTFELLSIPAEQCQYSYRSSLFKKEWRGKYIVVSVTYRLHKADKYSYKLDYGNIRAKVGDDPTLQRVREAVIEIRRSKLPEPAEMGSAGSFFINPVIERKQYNELLEAYPDMPCYEVDDEHVKIPAAWLIDKQGWKGKSVGGAMVYQQQCLVIVNTGNARAGHVVQLANDIAFSVLMAYRIAISPEVNYI